MTRSNSNTIHPTRSTGAIAGLLLALSLLLAACGGTGATTTAATTTAAADTTTAASDGSAEPRSFTAAELAEFDGEDGADAYIAVDGVVYDVTAIPMWAGGKHNGFQAGQDLTDEIKNDSPHGVSKLEDLPVVGQLTGN